VTHGAGQESDSVWFGLRFRVGVGRGARCVVANADLSREVGAGGQALERTFPPTKMNLNADSTSGTQVPLVVIRLPVCFEDSSKLREGHKLCGSSDGPTPRKLRCRRVLSGPSGDPLRRTSASLLGQPPRPVAWGRAVGEVSSWGLAGGHRSCTKPRPGVPSPTVRSLAETGPDWIAGHYGAVLVCH
jgi:hypothetical protein